MLWGRIRLIGQIECHPPKKRRALSPDLRMILLYSARKKRANPLAEYSTLYPDTSSASASGRSNGWRLVSASVVMKKITKIGRSGTPYQREDWPSTMLEKFRVPEKIRRETRVAPSETSYEILCAAERSPPRKAYLELLDQPALITECTLSDEMAKMYRSPSRKSEILAPSASGKTLHPALARPKVNTGDSMKIKVLALFGSIDSFRNSLSPSASGWKRP